MKFLFADDSRQRTPTRQGLGSLISIGGIIIDYNQIYNLENSINELCRNTGFPLREEFKWSPGRELWMHQNLIGNARKVFFEQIISLISQVNSRFLMVVEEENCTPTNVGVTNEDDAIILFLERFHLYLNRYNSYGIVIVDRPSGGRRDEDHFLLNCLETLQEGTDYIQHDRIAINVLSSPSKFIRILQAADFLTSCTLSYISGENQYSPQLFSSILPLFITDSNRIGGVGIKIHPDFKYVNLYHWLFRDSHYWRLGVGHPLPLRSRPYSVDPNVY